MSLYSSLTQVLAPFAAKINGLLTGWDGTKYSTPGEAVRTQINDLHVLIGHVPGQAIDASAVAYGNSDVGTELTNVNGRLQRQQGIIAEAFSAQSTYDVGDSVIYEAGLYTFRANKVAGAWDATKVDGPFKVTDQISSIKSDLTDVNAELADVRVGADGTTYASAGAAVRGQISELKNNSNTIENQQNKIVSLISPMYYGAEYINNTLNFVNDNNAIISIKSSVNGNALICGKNMFDDSYMKSLQTENPHEFYGMGADFNALPAYEFNNECIGMIFSASMKPESDTAMKMLLYITYSDDSTRRENFTFTSTTDWVRKSIAIGVSGKTVTKLGIKCSANTASKVYVKNIMLEKANSLTDFEPFYGEKALISSNTTVNKIAQNGQNNVVSDDAENALSIKVLTDPIAETIANDISSIKNDLYSFVATDDLNVESNRTAKSGVWGIIPISSAKEMIVNPSFSVDSGTYTVNHYSLSGDNQTATLIETKTAAVGDPVTYENVTPSDYFTFTISGGNVNYRNDSQQTFITKFSYLSSGKAIDYSNNQLAGTITFKNYVPKVNEKQLSGKTIVFFGDSRTWYDGKAYTAGTKQEWVGKICVGYQQAVKDLTGCNLINKGFSGYTSAQICEQIKAYDFTGIYAVYLSGGVNDFIKDDEIDVGVIQSIGSTFDTTTAYGAWQSAIEYLLTNYPQLKIYIDTPWTCWNWYGNLLPENIAEVKKNVADLYSIKCLDLYHISGINVINRDYYYVDDLSGNGQTRLHMNDYGNKWLGDIIGKYILSY